MSEVVNIASRLRAVAGRHPHKIAVVKQRVDRLGRARYDSVTFAELDRWSDLCAHALARRGLVRGMRTVVMVKPGIDFFALTFALFKLGAIVVLVDPGMGRKNLGQCLAEAEPEAFVGIPLTHAARKLLGWAKRTVRINVVVARSTMLDAKGDPRAFAIADTRGNETAAILFTSGSTGVPKGAVYTHGIFDAQVQSLRDTFGLGQRADEVDLATFPLFALFDAGLGVTAVIPDMNASKPAEAKPESLIAAVRDRCATQMFGSPSLLDRLGRHLEREKSHLPTLRNVITAGAPVRADILQCFAIAAPHAAIHTPYGATEALPVAVIESREILSETRHATANGAGICVGKPVPGAEVFIIRITDEPIAEWSDDLLLLQGEIGEIVVRGPMVTSAYCNRHEQTKLAKIPDADGRVLHRMGDVGYFDARGRLWFCGRKSQRVVTENGTLFPDQCEGIFNQHPGVFRTALVGVGSRGHQIPILYVDRGPRPGRPQNEAPYPWPALQHELLERAAAHPLTHEITTIHAHPVFATDVRHNAKIDREFMAKTATRVLRNAIR